MDSFSECFLNRARALENEHSALLDTLKERVAREEAMQHAIRDLQTTMALNIERTRLLNETIQLELKALRMGDHELHSRRTGAAHTSQNHQVRALKAQLTERANLVELSQKSQKNTLTTLEKEAEESMQFVKNSEKYKRLQQLKEAFGMVQNEVATRQNSLQQITATPNCAGNATDTGTLPSVIVTSATPLHTETSVPSTIRDKKDGAKHWEAFVSEVIRLAKYGMAMRKEMAKRAQILEARMVTQKLSVILIRCDRLEKLGELVERKQQEQQAIDDQMLTAQQKMSDLIDMQKQQSSQGEVRWIVGDSESSGELSRRGAYGAIGDSQSTTAVHDSQPEDHVTPTVRRTTRLAGGETEKAGYETQDTGFATNALENRSLQSKLGAADAGGAVYDVGNSSQAIEQVRTTGHELAPTYSDNAGLSSAEDKDVHTVQNASEEMDTRTVNVGSKHEANAQRNDMANTNCSAPMPSPLSDVDCSEMIEGSRQEEAADSAPTQPQPITNTELHITDTPDSNVEVEAETHNYSQDSDAKAHSDIQNSVQCKKVSEGACDAVAGSGSSASEEEEGGHVSVKEAKGQSEVSPKQSDLECAPEPIGQAQDNEGVPHKAISGMRRTSAAVDLLTFKEKNNLQIEESHETAVIETSHEADPHHMDLDVSTGSLEKGVESVTIGITQSETTHQHDTFVAPNPIAERRISTPVTIPGTAAEVAASSASLASPDLFKMFDSDSDSDDDFFQARKMYSSEKNCDTKEKSAASTTSTAKATDPTDINTRFSLGASGFDPFNNFNSAA